MRHAVAGTPAPRVVTSAQLQQFDTAVDFTLFHMYEYMRYCRASQPSPWASGAAMSQLF